MLDGIIPGCSFPEVNFATVHSITDARLIGNYFLNKATIPWTDEQKRQVVGFFGLVTMTTSTVYDGALRISPTGFCPSVLPAAERYNALTNPTGARCDVYDHAVNVFGRDPVTHFALRPLDNVGIQYGLAALNRGTVTVDQFLDLNEKVGGYDFDGNFKTSRTVGDIPAIRAAYRSGRLTNAGGGLRDVPIIDYRGYADNDPAGNIHLRYHSFSMRERLKKANGDADNQIMLVEDMQFYGLYSSQSPLLQFALKKMDQWIANIQGDDAEIAQHKKVVRNKPADLLEGCNTRSATPTFIVEKQTRDPSLQCEVLYPSAPPPREVAGANVTSDIIKCQLRAINPAEYPSMTPTQFSRLQSIFPTGVCDWSQPGIEQQPPAGTWQFF